MKVTELSLSGLVLIEADPHSDNRGSLVELFHADRYAAHGIGCQFVQDNLCQSRRDVLRGLHWQHPNGQAKLITAISGEIYDVAVDLRRGSPSFGQWEGVVLSDRNNRQFWLPEGFAHGFCVTSETAIVSYKLSALYDPDSEMTLAWDDPDLAISWPTNNPELSDRDRGGTRFRGIQPRQLPSYLARAS
jgi:dTDP-4-dehydrorhamnose 3,5-epimerase